jgi:hypothetical protein
MRDCAAHVHVLERPTVLLSRKASGELYESHYGRREMNMDSQKSCSYDHGLMHKDEVHTLLPLFEPTKLDVHLILI